MKVLTNDSIVYVTSLGQKLAQKIVPPSMEHFYLVFLAPQNVKISQILRQWMNN